MKNLLRGRNLALALVGLATLTMTSQNAFALHNYSLEQTTLLARDQYVDLVNPDHFLLDYCCVKFSEDTRIRLRDGQMTSLEGKDLSQVKSFLETHPNVRVDRLTPSVSEKDMDDFNARGEAESGLDLPDMNNWYAFQIDGKNLDPQGFLFELLAIDLVQTCYYEPIASPAECGVDPAPFTPDWENDQNYRNPAPQGVDIEYAWNYSAAGNGTPGEWFQDLEWGWCEDHEDYPSDFLIRNPPDSTDPDFYNHGTAVVSIVGACDDGKGVTGLVPENRLTARNVANHTNTADALTAIGTDLMTGEFYLIEMHGQGPSQGTTCECNCAQFRYIAMEYWQANFDAILINSGNTRYCIAAAGNGSMDLDWAGYGGAFDLGTRDSQAIIVGASLSGWDAEGHNPACWTNHGTRISAYAWGENIVAAGYGYLSNPAGCEQDYTGSFGGTSGASPIVTGPAISLAQIHEDQFASWPAPTTLRARLQTNATPQGLTDTWKEIAGMPNMHGILAPDLAPFLHAGWDDVIVPTVASGDPQTIPAHLNPAPALTYMNWGWYNAGRYGSASPARAYLYHDDVYQAFGENATLNPWSASSISNFARTVRGGLHYLKTVMDATDIVDESIEDNQTFIRAYSWDGMPLTADAPVTYTRGPKKNPEGYNYQATDGFTNSGNYSGFWEIFAVMPETSADYDIRLYDTDPTAVSGWETYVAYSGSVTSVDFVGQNNNHVSGGDWAGVTNYTDSAEDYTVEGQGSELWGSFPAQQELKGYGSLDAGEIFDVYEINATAGVPAWLYFEVYAGDADFSLYVFGPDAEYFDRYDYEAMINGGGGGYSEELVFTPTTSGYHGLVVIKANVADLAENVSYKMYWGPDANPDLTHAVGAGSDAELVPRTDGGSCGILPAILNEGTSVVDVGFTNIGDGVNFADWSLSTMVDGPEVYVSSNLAQDLDPGDVLTWCSRSLGTVKGGRHEVGSFLDVNGDVSESDESNNKHWTQYAWDGYELTDELSVDRSPAPNFRNSNNPAGYTQAGANADGYTFGTQYWTAVAAMPHNASDTYNLHGFSYTSSDPVTAFTSPVTDAYPGSGHISYCITNGNVVGSADHDYTLTNNFSWPGTPSIDSYTVQGVQSMGDMNINVSYPERSIDADDILNVFDVYVYLDEVDIAYPINLSYISGAADIGVALFQAGTDYADMADAIVDLNATGVGENEFGFVTFTNAGWYGLVVYKTAASDLGNSITYSLNIGDRQPAPITDLTIARYDFTPGNATVQIDFTPVAFDLYGNPLVVDHYRLYAVEVNPYDFSAPYVEDMPTSFNSGTGLLSFGNIGWTSSAFLFLTGIDEDGVIVAASPGIPSEILGMEPSGKALLSTLPQNESSKVE